jgi:hypothetical protein
MDRFDDQQIPIMDDDQPGDAPGRTPSRGHSRGHSQGSMDERINTRQQVKDELERELRDHRKRQREAAVFREFLRWTVAEGILTGDDAHTKPTGRQLVVAYNQLVEAYRQLSHAQQIDRERQVNRVSPEESDEWVRRDQVDHGVDRERLQEARDTAAAEARNDLIRELYHSDRVDLSQRDLAAAAGVSQQRVHQVVSR